MIIPDAIDPVVGFRVWLVDRHGLLQSINHNGLWEPGRHFEAYCARHDDPPNPKCTCGIYAAASFNQLFDMGYTKGSGLFSVDHGQQSVAGEINMWGGIVPGSQGWRVQYAYPKLFLIPFTQWRLAKPLSEKYGVPYRLFNLHRKH